MNDWRPSKWSARALATLVGLGALAQAPGARADTVILEATLRGAQEVPPVATPARGTGTVVLDTDTHLIRFTVTHDVADATAAHFHGSAFPGTSAGILVNIGSIAGLASPMVGEAAVTPEQEVDLLAGRWYINVHSGAHAGGEIRGQLSVLTPDPIAIFPRPGPLGRQSAFDLTILLRTAPGVAVTDGTVRLNGVEVTAGFAACVTLGTLAEGGGPAGLTLRCPVPGGLLSVGENFLSVVLELSDQSQVGTSATYDVADTTEP